MTVIGFQNCGSFSPISSVATGDKLFFGSYDTLFGLDPTQPAPAAYFESPSYSVKEIAQSPMPSETLQLNGAVWANYSEMIDSDDLASVYTLTMPRIATTANAATRRQYQVDRYSLNASGGLDRRTVMTFTTAIPLDSRSWFINKRYYSDGTLILVVYHASVPSLNSVLVVRNGGERQSVIGLPAQPDDPVRFVRRFVSTFRKDGAFYALYSDKDKSDADPSGYFDPLFNLGPTTWKSYRLDWESGTPGFFVSDWKPNANTFTSWLPEMKNGGSRKLYQDRIYELTANTLTVENSITGAVTTCNLPTTIDCSGNTYCKLTLLNNDIVPKVAVVTQGSLRISRSAFREMSDSDAYPVTQTIVQFSDDCSTSVGAATSARSISAYVSPNEVVELNREVRLKTLYGTGESFGWSRRNLSTSLVTRLPIGVTEDTGTVGDFLPDGLYAGRVLGNHLFASISARKIMMVSSGTVYAGDSRQALRIFDLTRNRFETEIEPTSSATSFETLREVLDTGSGRVMVSYSQPLADRFEGRMRIVGELNGSVTELTNSGRRLIRDDILRMAHNTAKSSVCLVQSNLSSAGSRGQAPQVWFERRRVDASWTLEQVYDDGLSLSEAQSALLSGRPPVIDCDRDRLIFSTSPYGAGVIKVVDFANPSQSKTLPDLGLPISAYSVLRLHEGLLQVLAFEQTDGYRATLKTYDEASNSWQTRSSSAVEVPVAFAGRNFRVSSTKLVYDGDKVIGMGSFSRFAEPEYLIIPVTFALDLTTMVWTLGIPQPIEGFDSRDGRSSFDGLVFPMGSRFLFFFPELSPARALISGYANSAVCSLGLLDCRFSNGSTRATPLASARLPDGRTRLTFGTAGNTVTLHVDPK